MKPDYLAQLRAIAEGEDTPTGPSEVDQAALLKHSRDFTALSTFAEAHEQGEGHELLDAPVGILDPLP